MNELWKIEHDRREKMQELMKEYDETVYRPAIRELQERCGEKGHVRGTFHDNGIGAYWWYCSNCGARMEITKYDLF